MIGTSLVTMPWAFQQAGILLGSVLAFCATLICWYTSYLCVLSARDHENYFSSISKYLGRRGWLIGYGSTFVVVYGAALGLMVIKSQLLYPVVVTLYMWVSGQKINLLPNDRILVFD